MSLIPAVGSSVADDEEKDEDEEDDEEDGEESAIAGEISLQYD